MRKPVLVTGGAGYVGSHACKQLAAAGFLPVVIDDLTTGRKEAVKWGPLIVANIAAEAAMDAIFAEYDFVAVLHFAASAYVGESMTTPEKYYSNNITAMISLLNAALRASVRIFIFSSSCATYGIPDALPIRESSPQLPVNPYGRTKLVGEWMLKDYEVHGLRHVSLRYFNAAGADPEGELCEWHEPETHLIPRALMAAAGRIDRLEVFGNNYSTPDGTCIRDFVHVSDLAEAHVSALRYLLAGGSSCAMNLGTGKGTSILEVIKCVSDVTGCEVPFITLDQRPGDPPVLYADAALARRLLSFNPSISQLKAIVETAAPFFIPARSHPSPLMKDASIFARSKTIDETI